MRYLSVCSGIEAASVAWHHLGWTPIAFSEIEPFPSAVLAHRFPNVPNLGDMTKHKEWKLEPGSIDLLVGGTPCQSFSVAGLRAGLEDPRGGLMLTFLEIAQRLRPRWIVWENVPGVLSSGQGRDFGSFLGALGHLGYGWAYRVLDAQWVRTQRHPRAVPQRRRRVFVVGCLGDWTAAAKVLFERESVQRDSAPRRASRKGAAADAEAGVGAGCWPASVASTLNHAFGDKLGLEDQHALHGAPLFVPDVVGALTAKGPEAMGAPEVDGQHYIAKPIWWDGGDCAGTLTKQNANGAQRMPDKDNFGAVLQPAVYRWQNDRDGLQADDASAALRSSAGTSGFHEMNHPVVVQGDTRATTVAVAFHQNQVGECFTSPVGFTVGTTGNASARNTSMAVVGTDCYNGAITGDVAATMGTPGSSVNASGPTVMSFHPLQDPIPSTVGSSHCMGTGGSQGHASIAVAQAMTVESLQQQGYNVGHASTQEADAIATLRVLRDAIGEEAFTAWGLGVLDSLQPSQVLRARLHGEGVRCASFSRSWPIDCAISRPEDRAAWAMQSVREAEGEGCSPSGRELPQQLSEQLGAYLSQLPHAGPQVERFMHHLWCAGEGIGFLRQALSAIQDARQSADVPRTTPATTMTVRRLTATECEFLQGFPRNWTLIPWRKKPAEECPDGPRYKALGNSMAVNCMAWIGERIASVDSGDEQ